MFVERNKDGDIVGVFEAMQYKDQEKLPDDHVDILAFKARPRDRNVINHSVILDIDKQALRDASTIVGLRTALLKILLDE